MPLANIISWIFAILAVFSLLSGAYWNATFLAAFALWQRIEIIEWLHAKMSAKDAGGLHFWTSMLMILLSFFIPAGR